MLPSFPLALRAQREPHPPFVSILQRYIIISHLISFNARGGALNLVGMKVTSTAMGIKVHLILVTQRLCQGTLCDLKFHHWPCDAHPHWC